MEASLVVQGCRDDKSQVRAGRRACGVTGSRCALPWPPRPRRTGSSRPATRWRPTCSRGTVRSYCPCACRPRTRRRGRSLVRSRWPRARSGGGVATGAIVMAWRGRDGHAARDAGKQWHLYAQKVFDEHGL
eukprot:2265572-Pyramimonas_sp.AAC.1